MGRVCTVCGHAEREAIDALIVARQPYRRIATQYSLTEAAVRRHRVHIPADVSKAHQAKETARADSLLVSIVTLRQRLEQALENTQVAKDVASLARELRETLRLMLELEGRLRQGAQVQVAVVLTESPEWLSLQARIVQALGPFPDARKAVLAAIAGPDVPDHAPVLPAHSPAVLDAPAAAVAAGSDAREDGA